TLVSGLPVWEPPSWIRMQHTEAALRNSAAATYSGSCSQASAFCRSGNSSSTMSSLKISPSCVSTLSPRVRNLPPCFATSAGVSSVYRRYVCGSWMVIVAITYAAILAPFIHDYLLKNRQPGTLTLSQTEYLRLPRPLHQINGISESKHLSR